jgi:hypothetical protein
MHPPVHGARTQPMTSFTRFFGLVLVLTAPSSSGADDPGTSSSTGELARHEITRQSTV